MTRPTYTAILLVLGSDGTSRAYKHGPVLDIFPEIAPAASGADRGPYRTYLASGYSIDVMQLVKPSAYSLGRLRK